MPNDTPNVCESCASLKRQVEELRRQVFELAKGDPEAAELVLTRIVTALDKHIEEGVWPEKVEQAIDGLVLERDAAIARAEEMEKATQELGACLRKALAYFGGCTCSVTREHSKSPVGALCKRAHAALSKYDHQTKGSGKMSKQTNPDEQQKAMTFEEWLDNWKAMQFKRYKGYSLSAEMFDIADDAWHARDAQLAAKDEEIERLKDETAHESFEQDVLLNAFMRFCYDKMKMPQGASFGWGDGYKFIESQIAALQQQLRDAQERLNAWIERHAQMEDEG